MNRDKNSFYLFALYLWLGLSGLLHSSPFGGVMDQAIRNAARQLPPGHEAIHTDGYPLVLCRDWDGDGMEDIFLLSTKQGEGPLVTDSRVLSEYSRVFDAKSSQPFFLHLFTRRQNTVALARTIQLGVKRVLGGFNLFEIRHAARVPFGIETVFPNRLGMERVWVLVSSSSRIETFVFQEQPSIKSYVKDINNDGFLDLILFEDQFEDSVGYETYASWYQWEGGTFKRHRSVNILRNLRSFLQTLKQQILAKNWDAFFRFALRPQDASFAKGVGVEAALSRVFRVPPPPLYPVAGLETEPVEIDVLGKNFIDLVYPEILQNPFNLREDGPESFLLTFRLVVEGKSYLLSTRVAMYGNFFGDRQFHLVLQ